VAIHRAATQFVDGYLEVLSAIEPNDVRRQPCFGYGRGGIAYTLLKAGLLRGTPALVEAAERWAVAGLRSGHRFRMRGWPKASFSRGMTGLHGIHALAAHAAGHDTACRDAIDHFVRSARRGRGTVELFQGMAGRLAGAAAVMRRIPDPRVRALGDELGARIVSALDEGRVALRLRGVAHGNPGVVLGLLAWQGVARSLPEDALRRAVIALHPYDVSALVGRRKVDWAHGHAGMAHLFARAYVLLGDRRFLRWARASAEQARTMHNLGYSLLSGSAGIAYSLLAVAAADPEGPWRDAAWTLAAEVLWHLEPPDESPYGIWAGLGGMCCLALDLVHGTEGWFPGVEA
jgi:hypothetical protein